MVPGWVSGDQQSLRELGQEYLALSMLALLLGGWNPQDAYGAEQKNPAPLPPLPAAPPLAWVLSGREVRARGSELDTGESCSGSWCHLMAALTARLSRVSPFHGETELLFSLVKHQSCKRLIAMQMYL